ncbi:acyltransferase [Salinicola aestuarinus]|uniref:acyltransferase n=1 Tax=Salinicola aestuarinus TaxID=1949082 RepID=UPI001300953C|nr:hypothetical protein [Salinicola aestuarinus]
MKKRFLTFLRSMISSDIKTPVQNAREASPLPDGAISRSTGLPNFKIEADAESNIINLEGLDKARGSLRIGGVGNEISVGKRVSLNCHIRIQGKGNRLHIGDDCNLRGQILIKGNSQTVSIGDSTTFQTVYLLCQEGCNITVGRHCMFSREIEVRTTDAHSLVDISSGARLNKPQSIVIGDHVWVGLRALINKGAFIPDDSIVGAAAFVNSAHEESHTVLAGVPAKVVRRGVTWNRGRKESFTEAELLDW